MTELAKCPLCGAAPSVGATDRAGLSWDISCCDATFVFQSHWNRYAAAMDSQTKLDELLDRVAWMLECELARKCIAFGTIPYNMQGMVEIMGMSRCARKAVEELL